MPFRSFRFLNILLDFPQLSPYTWQYVPNREISFARIQEPKHRSPFLAPMNKTSIMLEIPCNKGDEIWNADQKSLFQRAISELKDLGFDIENHVIDYFCTNAEHGIPIGMVNIKEHQQKAYQALRTFKNVSTAGRQGFFTYIFSNSAMEMGMKAGQYIHQVYLKKVAPDTYSYMRFHSDFDVTAEAV